ncbi:MAG: DUF4179 domain-containing protein [Candidatus Aphodomorpha sp.]
MTEREYYHDVLEQTLLSGNALREKLHAERPVPHITMLHGEQKRPCRRLTRRTALVLVAAATLLVSGAALAAGLVLSGKGSRIGFFSNTGDPELRAQQGYYERTSDAVGLPLTGESDPATLIIDNIAIDGEQVTVFYTAGMNESLPEAAQPPAPYLSVNDGVRQLSHEQLVYAERTDAHTLICMQSFTVPGGVPQTCTLTVGFDSLFGKSGDWRRTFEVDLTGAAADALVAYPNAILQVDDEHFHHAITVRTVTMDKTGGTIVFEETSPGNALYRNEAYRAWGDALFAAEAAYLAAHPDKTVLDWQNGGPLDAYLSKHPCPLSEEEQRAILDADTDAGGPDFVPFLSFAVFNDRNESLNPRIDGITGSGWGKPVQNRVYFTPDSDTAYLRIVPILGRSGEHSINMMFDALGTPIKVTDALTVTLLDVQVDAAKRTVTISYREDGVTDATRYSKESVVDTSGAPIANAGDVVTPEAPFRDDTTGVYTETLTFLSEDMDVTRVGGVVFRYSVPVLDETNALIVRLK